MMMLDRDGTVIPDGTAESVMDDVPPSVQSLHLAPLLNATHAHALDDLIAGFGHLLAQRIEEQVYTALYTPLIMVLAAPDHDLAQGA